MRPVGQRPPVDDGVEVRNRTAVFATAGYQLEGCGGGEIRTFLHTAGVGEPSNVSFDRVCDRFVALRIKLAFDVTHPVFAQPHLPR